MAKFTAAKNRAARLIEEARQAEKELLLSVGETVRTVHEKPKTKAAREYSDMCVREFAALVFGDGTQEEKKPENQEQEEHAAGSVSEPSAHGGTVSDGATPEGAIQR